MTEDDSDAHQLLADSVVAHAERLGRLIDYIEVGVCTGNSAAAVLSTCKVRNAILVDDFSNAYCGDFKSSKQTVEQNLEAYTGLFEIREGDSKTVLPLLTEKFDIGFVDGDHSAAGCQADMENMLPLLRNDGIIFVHDLRNPGHMYLKEVVETFARNNKLNMKYHPHVHNALGELSWQP